MTTIAKLRHYLGDLHEPFHSRRALLRALFYAIVKGVDTEICRRCGRPVSAWSGSPPTSGGSK